MVSTLAQVYGVEEPDEEEEPATFLEDVVLVITSFIAATIDTIKSIPLIFGIDLFGDEVDDTPSGLMTAIRSGFEASSGGHGAGRLPSWCLFCLTHLAWPSLPPSARNSALSGCGPA